MTTPVRGLINPEWEEGWGCPSRSISIVGLGNARVWEKTLDRWQDIVFKICFSDQKYIPGKYDVILKIYGISIKYYSFTILHSRYFNFGMFYCTLSSNQAKSGKQVPSKGNQELQHSYTEPRLFYPYLYLSMSGLKISHCGFRMWVWVNTYRYHIYPYFSGMNIHLPAILGFTRYRGFDPSPCFRYQHYLVGGAIINHLEKWWSSSMLGGWHPIYEMENKNHVWNHQPVYIYMSIQYICWFTSWFTH